MWQKSQALNSHHLLFKKSLHRFEIESRVKEINSRRQSRDNG